MESAMSAFARLPFVEEIFSAGSLSKRLGFAAVPVRIRIKPGHSALLAWRREVPAALEPTPGWDELQKQSEYRGQSERGWGDWGWIAVMTDPDKIANVHRRALKHGFRIRTHEGGPRTDQAGTHEAGIDGPANRLGEGPVLLSGDLRTDPKLARAIARVDPHLSGTIEVLGYNPGRRVLVRHTDSEGERSMVRISAEANDHLRSTAVRWAGWGVPTLPVAKAGKHRTAVSSPWWGMGNLDDHPEPTTAAEVGRTMAMVHRQGRGDAEPAEVPAGGEGPEGFAPLPRMEAAVRELAGLLPNRAGDLHDLALRIGAGLTGNDLTGNGSATAGGLFAERAIHGDLSPDQVLVSGEEFRIIDLDRAGYGPIGLDLGNWMAACRMSGRHELEEGFLNGYFGPESGPGHGRARRGREVTGGLEFWCARALLVSAIEPLRACDPDWREQIEGILAAAEEAVNEESVCR